MRRKMLSCIALVVLILSCIGAYSQSADRKRSAAAQNEAGNAANNDSLKDSKNKTQPDYFSTLVKGDKRVFCPDCEDGPTILYDFECKRLFFSPDGKKGSRVNRLGIIKVKHMEELKFKIVNVNRYIYNVKFSVDNIDFGSEPPKLFSQFFLGSGDYLDGLLAIPAAAKAAAKNDLEPLQKALSDFKAMYDGLIDGYVTAYKNCGSLRCCKDVKTELFSTFSKQLTNVKFLYNQTFMKSSLDLVEAEKALAEAKKKQTDCEAKQEELKKLKAADKKDPAKIKALEDEIKKKCNSDFIKDELATNELNVKNRTIIKETLEKLWASFAKPTEEQLLQLVLFKNNLVQEHLTYTAPPIYPQGHQLSFGLKIYPRDTASSLVSKWNIMPMYNDSMGFVVMVRNKPFVSFSTGVFAGFGKNLHDQTYEWQPQPNGSNTVSDSAQYKLVSTGKASPPVGLSALAHFGLRPGKAVGFGFSIGAGISIEDNPRPVYLAGGSLLIGGKNQFGLTVGIAAMQVKKLRSELYPNMSTVLYDTKPSTIEYKKGLEAGGFVSITYSIFSLGSGRSVSSGL